MSSYKNIDIKTVYDSNDDILKFYNTTLELTHVYKRASGFFTQGLLNYISKGLLGLVRNKGKLFLVISHRIDNDTLEKIESGYKLFSDKNVGNDTINFEELEENISDLAFLISIGLVKIKIAYSSGLYHEKYGILIDGSGNKILFSGSNNETKASIDSNFESFETTISWDCSNRDLEKIQLRENAFDKLWNNKVSNLTVLEIPEALHRQILKSNNPIKTIQKIPEKSIYIDYSRNLSLNLNFDFDFSAWFLFKRWKDREMIKKQEDNLVVFDEHLGHVDIQYIVKMLKEYMNHIHVNVLISERALNLFKNHLLDLDLLSKQGKNIKRDSYKASEDFLRFKDEQNALLKRSLRDAQVLASKHIVDLKRTLNFSVPGFGKTATVLGAFEYLKNNDKVDKLLIIGPKNCFKSWRDEIHTVLQYTSNEILELNSSPNFDDKRIELKYNYNSVTFVMVNFEGTMHASSIISEYIDDRVMVVFDEIHRIKRIDGQYYLGTLDIVQSCPYRVALTGTPLPNGYRDLHNQFEILYGDYAKTYFGFNIESLKHKDRNFSKFRQLSSEVKIRMYPFYIRINKNDLSVPNPEPDNICKVYESDEVADLYQNISGFSKPTLQKIIDKLQVGIIPEKVNQDIVKIDKSYTSKKIKKIEKLVKEIVNRGEFVVIWTHFISSLKKLVDNLSTSFSVGAIYGDVDQDERDRIIDSFNNGEIQVLITNPHTLAESVSLHKICNNAIYAEISYNLTHFLQSRDRIHRLGIAPDRKTNYYIVQSYYGENSIDADIYNILQEKKLRMNDSIDSSFMLEILNEEIIKELEGKE